MQVETHVTWPLSAAELRPALELALELAHADMTVLLLHDEVEGVLFPALAHGIDDEQFALIGSHRAGADAFGIALSERRRVVIRDAWTEEERLRHLAHALGFRAIEIVPLVGDGQMFGEIAMMFRRCAQIQHAAHGQAGGGSARPSRCCWPAP